MDPPASSPSSENIPRTERDASYQRKSCNMRDGKLSPVGEPRKARVAPSIRTTESSRPLNGASQGRPVDSLSATIRAAVAAEIDRLRDELTEVVSARPLKRLIDRNELCQSLGVSAPIIRRLEDDGMPMVRLGEVGRYDLDQVLQWLETRNAVEPANGESQQNGS